MIPPARARFGPVPGEPRAFVPIEYLIELFGDPLFPGFTIRSLGVFRIIRDSDIVLEEEAEHLVRLFRTAIRRRRPARVFLMALAADIPAALAVVLAAHSHRHEASFVQHGLFSRLPALSR